MTRLSLLIFQSNWLYPTSIAYINFEPFCRAQSENPPVDDQIYTTVLPSISIIKEVNAFSILKPPHLTYLILPLTTSGISSSTFIPGLSIRSLFEKTRPAIIILFAFSSVSIKFRFTINTSSRSFAIELRSFLIILTFFYLLFASFLCILRSSENLKSSISFVDFRLRAVRASLGHGDLPPKHRTCKCKFSRWGEHLAQSQVLRQDVAFLTCLAEEDNCYPNFIAQFMDFVQKNR